MWSWFKVCLYILLLVSAGCGYTVSHRVKKEFDHPQGIFVSVFSNDTEELGAEMVFTNALLREMKLHQTFHLVDDKERAGLQLEGVVESITYQPTALYAPNPAVNKLQPYVTLPDQMNLVVRVKLNLKDKNTKQVLWTQTTSGSRIVSASLTRTGDKEAASGFGLFTQSLLEGRYEDIA
ncbi:MAG: hypothetical protein ACKOA8_15400, partial [Deltaproteobacteria bacterium]